MQEQVPMESREFKNVIVCWKCDGELALASDRVEDVFDIPEACPGCGTSWANARWFAWNQDASQN